MNIFFNDLSMSSKDLAHTTSKEDIINALIESLKAVSALNQSNQTFYLTSRSDIYGADTPFIHNQSLHEIVQELTYERKSALIAFMHRIRIITEGETQHIETQTNKATKAYSGYLENHIKHFALSLNSSDAWSNPELIYETGDKTDRIPHLSTPTLKNITTCMNRILPILMFFSSMTDGNLEKSLPKSEISDFILTQPLISAELKAARSLKASERNAIHLSIGTTVALINSFELNTVLSAKNSTQSKIRKIFTHPSTGTHISIDTMHGGYEVHKADGEHKSEINFYGLELSKRDVSGRHNIKV